MAVRRACSAVASRAARSPTHAGHLSPMPAAVASMIGWCAMHQSRGAAVPPMPMERSGRLLGLA
eukprot:3428884-Pyramimonas_sp.AAC.1